MPTVDLKVAEENICLKFIKKKHQWIKLIKKLPMKKNSSLSVEINSLYKV